AALAAINSQRNLPGGNAAAGDATAGDDAGNTPGGGALFSAGDGQKKQKDGATQTMMQRALNSRQPQSMQRLLNIMSTGDVDDLVAMAGDGDKADADTFAQIRSWALKVNPADLSAEGQKQLETVKGFILLLGNQGNAPATAELQQQLQAA